VTASAEAGWLAVGRIRRPHGLHGEVVVEQHSDFPARVASGVEVGIGEHAPTARAVIHRVREHKGQWLISFVDIQARHDVERWRDFWLFLPAQERAQLPANYYYEHELVACHCVAPDGAAFGTVGALTTAGGGPLLEVETERGTVLVPFVAAIVVSVDLVTHTIVLDPPRGLFDDDAL
jgi:16S rRNA processing protein RimM